MFKYTIKNILMIIPTMFCVVFIVFSINHLTPGDPVAVVLNYEYTQEQYDAKAAELGLDKPFFTQFYIYVKNIITKFDFGISYKNNIPVMKEISQRFPVTLRLGILSCIVTVLIGIPFGIISAIKQSSALDYILTIFSLILAAIPGFWLSMMMIILFSLELKWLPASGMTSWKCYVMPVIASAASSIAAITRQTRSSMLEVIRQDYIRTAKAKGLSEGTILRKHALKNAMIPIITLIGMQIGMVISGSAIIEAIHSFPGMGSLMLTAINGKDYNTIQTIVLFLSAIVCALNVLVDIAYAFVDPRIKAQYAKNVTKKKVAINNVKEGNDE